MKDMGRKKWGNNNEDNNEDDEIITTMMTKKKTGRRKERKEWKNWMELDLPGNVPHIKNKMIILVVLSSLKKGKSILMIQNYNKDGIKLDSPLTQQQLCILFAIKFGLDQVQNMLVN